MASNTLDPFEGIIIEDRQISYELTISTIRLLFDEEVAFCRENIDKNLAEYLEGFKEECLFYFKGAYEGQAAQSGIRQRREKDAKKYEKDGFWEIPF